MSRHGARYSSIYDTTTNRVTVQIYQMQFLESFFFSLQSHFLTRTMDNLSSLPFLFLAR